jgi:iron complex transport system substrate-binding protein
MILAFSTVGCGKKSEKKANQKITFTDDAGKKFTLEKPAEKVVSLAPSNTEIVYAIGGGGKLVGVTTYCDYPEEAKKKEKVGDFATPNTERIASLDPQVVLATGGVQQNVVDSLNKFGIKVIVIDPKSFSGLFRDMEKVGEILGLQEEAKSAAKELKQRVDEVEKKVKGLARPRVFFEIYKQPLMTAGKNTLIDMMIDMAGGTNIGAKAGEEFPQFSEEKLIKENPDIYIAVKGSQSDPADIAKRPGYEQIEAVSMGRVYAVEDNYFVRSGPRLAKGLEMLAKIIHPEAFKGSGD